MVNKSTLNMGELIQPTKKNRIWELDFLRGLCVLLMVWDHFMYDITAIFGDVWATEVGGSFLEGLYSLSNSYFTGSLREIFHPIIFSMFFVICGISCSFSKSNLLRGIQALILAYAITIVTALLGMPIRFGVLHMLGFSIILWWIIDTICRHNKYATAIVSFALGCLIIMLDNHLSVNGAATDGALSFLHEVFCIDFDYSADYFPLIPHAGVMLIGASVAPFIYAKRKSLLPWLDKYHWHTPISSVGRIALPVYVLHQLIIGAILAIISMILVGDFIIV